MTLQLIELADSRDGQVSPDPANQLVTRKYLLSGTDDELTARQTVESSLSAFLDGQAFNNYRLSPRGAGIWNVEASYGKKKNPGLVTLNFDSGEEKIKITRAPYGSAYYPTWTTTTSQLFAAQIRFSGSGYALNDVLTITGGTHTTAAQVKVTAVDALGTIAAVTVQTVGSYTVIPDNPLSVTGGAGSGALFFGVWVTLGGSANPIVNYKGALGIKSHQGEVKAEGIDREVQAFGFTMQVVFGPTFPLTSAFVALCDAAAWHTNSAPIDVTIAGIDFPFATGELLFKGATGMQKSGGSGVAGYSDFEGEVTLKFGKQKNLSNVAIAGIPGVTKNGWDYLEVISEEDVEAGEFIPAAKQINVSQIYDQADLTALFIGAPTIASFSPTSGNAQTPVTITGTNFFGVTAVLINGTQCPYFVVSSISIQIIVPDTAPAGAGPITVKASGGSVNSSTNFTVT